MPFPVRRPMGWLPALVLAAACSSDDARSHVYRSAPPPAAANPATASLPVSIAQPEPPIGSGFARARIAGVRLSSSGAPASLDLVTEDVDVTALVTRGRGSSSAGPARLELVVTGAKDSTMVARFDSPVPIVIAHEFRVAVGSGAGRLPAGRYRLQARLVRPGARTVESVALDMEVRPAAE